MTNNIYLERKGAISFIIALISVLIITQNVSSYNPDLDIKWRYDLNGIPLWIYMEDLDNDGSDEFIFALSRGIFVIDNRGQLIWDYDIDNIRAVSIADINNDGYNEIVISSGGIAEEIARGWIISLDRNGRMLWKFPPSRVGSTTLMQDIKAIDIDNNRYHEIIGASMYGISALKDTHDGFLWRKKIDEGISDIEITEIVPGIKSIIANSFSNVYLLDMNGTLLWNYTINGKIETLAIANVYGDGNKDILVVSKRGRLYVLNSKGELELETATAENVTADATADLDTSYNRVFLCAEGVVYSLNSKFQTNWEYSAGKGITGIYITDHDNDGKKEILISAGDRIYEIDENGNLLWEYDFDNSMEKFILADMDNDNYDEIIATSGSRVYAFDINRTYINRQRADSYYKLAYNYFNSGNYGNATVYLENAINLYTRSGDIEDVVKSRLLHLRISAEVRNARMELADSYYGNAESSYNASDYRNAKEYVEKAIGIYAEINDKNKLSKSKALLLKIEDATKHIRTTTTSTTTTSLAKIPDEEPIQNYGKIVVFAIPVLLAIVLIFIILKRKAE